MSWRERAAAAIAERGRGEEPPKPTEPSSVSFGGSHTPLVSSTEPANDGADHGAEARRSAALAYLEAHPEAARACFADVKADSANIVLTVAVREPWGAVEVLVSRDRFDALALMELAERYPATSLFVPEH